MTNPRLPRPLPALSFWAELGPAQLEDVSSRVCGARRGVLGAGAHWTTKQLLARWPAALPRHRRREGPPPGVLPAACLDSTQFRATLRCYSSFLRCGPLSGEGPSDWRFRRFCFDTSASPICTHQLCRCGLRVLWVELELGCNLDTSILFRGRRRGTCTRPRSSCALVGVLPSCICSLGTYARVHCRRPRLRLLPVLRGPCPRRGSPGPLWACALLAGREAQTSLTAHYPRRPPELSPLLGRA